MSGSAMESFDALTVPLDAGVTLVEASAGTGKTFAITRVLLRLLLEKRVEKLSQVLVVTFTEKATQELVTRIRKTLRVAERVWSDSTPPEDLENADLFKLRRSFPASGRAVILDALSSLDDLAVSTIHGFCHRMLAESALESAIPFRTTFVENDTEPLGRAVHDWARCRLLGDRANAELTAKSARPLDEWVKLLVEPYRRAPFTRIEFDQAQPAQVLLDDFVRNVDESFTAEKLRRHLLDFDDLLRRMWSALEREGAGGPLARRIRAKFRAALIDEFQDTDRTQYPIFSTAFAGCPLFLIGDPKQSIYRFRGADIGAYLQAAQGAEKKYTLMRNYRSTPAYVQVVEQLFTRAADPFLVGEARIAFPAVKSAADRELPSALQGDGSPAMVWWWVDGTLGNNGKYVTIEEAKPLLVRETANEIVRLREAGLPAKSIAVLVRTNEETRRVKEALDRAGVASVISGENDVFESDEGKELELLASAVATPHNGHLVRAAMATRLWGCDAEQVLAIRLEGADQAWNEAVDRLRRAREDWRTKGVASGFGELLAERGSAERLLALPDGQRRLTNVRHLLELMHEAWVMDGLAPEGFRAWMAAEGTVPNAPERAPERRQLRLETDADAVQILTIHKCKGLEFDVVFCLNLWHKREPKRRNGPLGVTFALAQEDQGGAVLDLGSSRNDDRRDLEAREDSQENVRLAYVALTRAVHRCYVACGDIGKASGSRAKSRASKARSNKAAQPNPSVRAALESLLRPSEEGDERTVLEGLAAGSGGQMVIRKVEKAVERLVFRHSPTTPGIVEALPIRLAAHQTDTWRIGSFTGLTAAAHAESYGENARDLDDPILAAPASGPPPAAPGFRGFPAGTGAGTALHDLLEEFDFMRASEPEVRARVEGVLAGHRLLGTGDETGRRVADAIAMLQTLSMAPIPGAGFSLSDVPREAALREWEFHLPVGGLSTRGIADVLAAHGSAHARSYAPMLRALDGGALSGYLKGFVDLAFEHDGRWWLVDWKSNQLGPNDADYAPAALAGAMNAAHYTLQYHLYLLALHRHLRARQPGYDPARDWGGVAYVFLRGVTGAGENGWFRDAPSAGLLQALDAMAGRRT